MRMFKIPRVDGGVVIMQVFTDADPAGEVKRWHPDEQAKVDVSGIKPVKPSDIPSDRTFRNAWTPDLTVDIAKARGVWKQKMRTARVPKFALLDAEADILNEKYVAGTISADERTRFAQVTALKKELRDVTAHPGIAAARTPDELKAVWPDCLK